MISERNRARTALRVLMVLLVGLTGCGKSASMSTPGFQFDVSAFDETNAWTEVVGLTEVGARPSGSEGSRKAAAHLAGRFRAHGLEPVTDEFTDVTPNGPVTFRNVWATVPGGGRGIVVIGSHYDTKSGIGDAFVGANDSGSSTGVLLELARAIRTSGYAGSGGPDVVLVAFDGEECAVAYGPNDGFHGSRYMARALDEAGRAADVRAVVVLDMIGDRDLKVSIPRNSSPSLIQSAFRAAEQEGARSRFSLHPNDIGDDHVAFLDRGMPAIDLIDFEYGTQPGKNDYWHTLEDTLDKLSPASLGLVGRVTLRMLNEFIQPPDEH